MSYGYFGLNIICPILTVFSSFLFLRYIFPLLMTPEEAYKKEILEKGDLILRLYTLIIPLGFMIGSLRL